MTFQDYQLTADLIPVPIPERINVSGNPYRVVLVNSPESPLSEGEVLGLHSAQKAVIYLNTRPGKQSSYELKDTLLHELLHAVFDTAFIKTDEEEDIIGRLTVHLLDTLRRNPKLVAYLMG